HLKDAVKAFKKAVAIAPNDSSIRFNYAYALFLAKDKDADEQAAKSLEMNPNHAGALYLVGIFDFQKGNAKLALENSERALQIESYHAPAMLLNAAASLAMIGTKDPDKLTTSKYLSD